MKDGRRCTGKRTWGKGTREGPIDSFGVGRRLRRADSRHIYLFYFLLTFQLSSPCCNQWQGSSRDRVSNRLRAGAVHHSKLRADGAACDAAVSVDAHAWEVSSSDNLSRERARGVRPKQRSWERAANTLCPLLRAGSAAAPTAGAAAPAAKGERGCQARRGTQGAERSVYNVEQCGM